MRFNTLNDWLEWQGTLHSSAIELGLDRVKDVANRLGISKPAPHIIMLAGTNGKGSTTAMLESIYHAAGYSTGVYTSPHILHYNERIRLNQQAVNDARLCELFEEIDQARGGISLTYFEFGTLAALHYFQQQQPDVCILETGLGGRLDAVNIVDADVALITSIDLDHQAWLGDTREAIALEKFGISRPGKPLVLGDPEPPASLINHATESKVTLYRVGHEFEFEDQQSQWQWRFDDTLASALPYPALRGKHQLLNASSAIMCTELLKVQLPVSRAHLRLGLESAQLPGRFQVWNEQDVTTIIDVAHNPQATRSLAENIRQIHKPGNCVAVLGMLADKDPGQSLKALLGLIDHWYLCDLDTDRNIGTDALSSALQGLGVGLEKMSNCSSVEQAYKQAEQKAQSHDIILAFGSFFTVAEMLRLKQYNHG